MPLSSPGHMGAPTDQTWTPTCCASIRERAFVPGGTLTLVPSSAPVKILTESVLGPPATHAVAGGCIGTTHASLGGVQSDLPACVVHHTQPADRRAREGLTRGSSRRADRACVNEMGRGVGGAEWIKTCANETSRCVGGSMRLRRDQYRPTPRPSPASGSPPSCGAPRVACGPKRKRGSRGFRP